MEDREQQDEVGAGGAQHRQLDLLDDELLGQDRDGDRRPHRPQVVDRAAEPVRLAQDRDRRRAAGLVGAGPGDDVVAGGGDPPGRRRGALDLGDEVQARRREALGDRAWRGAPPRRARRSRPGPSPATSARMSARRRAAISRDHVAARRRGARPVDRRRSCRCAAGRRRAGVRGRRLGGASLGAQRPRAARRPARRRWSAPPARSPPPAGSTTPADEQRRAGVEEDDVAPDAGLAAQDGLDHPGVLVRRPAGQPRGRRALEPERGGIDDVALDRCRRPRRTATPLPSSGSSSTPSPWMTKVRSVPSRRDDLGHPRGRPPGRRRRAAAGVVPAGLVSGPSRLNAVRTPISRRVGPACCIAGWKFGANRNAKPMRRAARRRPTPRRGRSGCRAHRGRRPSPAFEVIARLPCLATGTPAAAATSAAVVEMLNVPLPSPPVPTTSIAPSGASTRTTRSRIARGEAGQLVDGLAAHPQAHQQGRQLGRRRLAVHDRAHRRRAPRPSTACRRRRSWRARPGPARSSDALRRPASASPAVANEPDRVVEPRRLAFAGQAQEVREQVRALGVRTRSRGGTGRPRAAATTWRMPMITRSTSLIAVTRSSGGSVAGSTASEW